MTDFNFNFSGDDEVKGGSIPNGAIVVVSAVPQKDPSSGAERMLRVGKGTNSGKIYMGIKYQVVEPEDYAGRKVDSTLWADNTEAKFRAQVEMITGRRLPRKGDSESVELGPEDIEQALKEHSFRVKVGPDKNGYTEVKYYNERVDRVEPQIQEIGTGASGAGEAGAAGGADFDDWGDDGDDDDDDF